MFCIGVFSLSLYILWTFTYGFGILDRFLLQQQVGCFKNSGKVVLNNNINLSFFLMKSSWAMTYLTSILKKFLVRNFYYIFNWMPSSSILFIIWVNFFAFISFHGATFPWQTLCYFIINILLDIYVIFQFFFLKNTYSFY